MAGYYDPNKDYSKAISEAKAAGKDTSRLEAERQNKINDPNGKYKGKEPTMYGSNKTYSQASRDNDRDTISNAISISNGKSSGSSPSGSSSTLVKGPGYVTGGYTTGVNGTPILGDNPYWNKNTTASGADMSRRTDLKNGMAVSNGYTVFYDEDGYAVKAVKGAVDYLPRKDLNASNGSYNTSGAWTDIEMMGDKPGSDYYKIQDIRAALQRGEINGDQANAAANDIRSKYGYTIDKQGNVYDSGVGASVAARRTQYGLNTNVTDAQQKYLQLMFPEQMNQDNGSLLSAYMALKNGNYNPNTVYTGIQQTGQQYGDLSNGVNLNLGEPYGMNFGSGSLSIDIYDATQYLKDMYAQNLQAELAALKSTYEQNVLDYQAQDDLISAEAQRQRNQAAAQNELQRMYMNEMGIMQGLNTGMTGQMALAQSAALQGNLANIGTQEQQALSDSALERSKLKAQYSAAVDQAVAQNNYELANALYQEYVRQDTLAQQKAAAALEQQNWLDKFNYQKEQDALAQQNWQAQFDYQKQQDDLNYQLTLQKLYGANVGSTGSPVKTPSVGYNNGSLTTAQVMQLQEKLGVTADGKWGSKSSTAAGGLTADEAWAKYGGYDMSFEELKSTITRYLSLGGAQRAQNILDAHWDSITPAQQKELSKLFG